MVVRGGLDGGNVRQLDVTPLPLNGNDGNYEGIANEGMAGVTTGLKLFGVKTITKIKIPMSIYHRRLSTVQWPSPAASTYLMP